MKRCPNCEEYKEFGEFHRNKHNKDGYHFWCKKCRKYDGSRRDYMRKYTKSDKWKAWVRQYRKTEKGRASYIAYNSKRRAKCRDTDITSDWLLSIKGTTCPVCDTEMNDIWCDPHSRNLDHIIPLCKGGKHMKDNVRYVCQTCNLTKYNRGDD
jgi:5-methylcytosine-specific restriction endonuclease McrA